MKITYKSDPEISIKWSDSLAKIEKRILDDFREYQGETPKALYHYCGTDALIGILSSQHVWFTHVDYFHDYSEVKHGASLICSSIEEIRSNNPLSKKQNIFLEALLEKYQNPFKNFHSDIFVSCFCEKPDVLSQWERFANQSAGYSLGFEFTDSLKLGYTPGRMCGAWMLKVIYEEKHQNAIIQNSIKLFLEHLADEIDSKPYDSVNLFQNLVGSLIYAFKNKFFSEENEWRILINLISTNGSNSFFEKIQFRNSNGRVVPYLQIRFIEPSLRDPYFPLREVWIGPRAAENDAKSINFMLGKHSLSDVAIKSSLIPLRK